MEVNQTFYEKVIQQYNNVNRIYYLLEPIMYIKHFHKVSLYKSIILLNTYNIIF